MFATDRANIAQPNRSVVPNIERDYSWIWFNLLGTHLVKILLSPTSEHNVV